MEGKVEEKAENGSTGRKMTLYEQYQENLSSVYQDKSSKGNYILRKPRSGSAKSKKQEGSTTEAAATAPPPPPPEAAVDGSSGDPNRNKSGEWGLSNKKLFDKKYEYPSTGVRGFMKDEMSLEIMLLQDGKDEIRKIGVVGLPGVGKTTLCKFILDKNERVKERYDQSQIVWINLPEIAKEGEIDGIIDLYSAADALSNELLEYNEKLNENKYLLVIDDVDEDGDDAYYEKLKNCIDGLPKGKGGAVIVICRSEEKAMKVVGDRYLHRLQPLNNPNSCWWIYNEAVKGAELGEEDGKVSKEVKEELMKRCGGLPGAARMLGKIKAQQVEEKNRANQIINAVI